MKGTKSFMFNSDSELKMKWGQIDHDKTPWGEHLTTIQPRLRNTKLATDCKKY